MPIGVPRIIYCWGEELPAQWTDIYNFIFRRRMVFLMQYLDDELCNQICGLLINIHMEDRSKDLEKKEMENSGLFKNNAGKPGISNTFQDLGQSSGAKAGLKNKKEKSIEDLMISEEDLKIDENHMLERQTLQKISLEWLNWNAQFFDYSDEPYLFYLAELLSKDMTDENSQLLYNFGSGNSQFQNPHFSKLITMFKNVENSNFQNQKKDVFEIYSAFRFLSNFTPTKYKDSVSELQSREFYRQQFQQLENQKHKTTSSMASPSFDSRSGQILSNEAQSNFFQNSTKNNFNLFSESEQVLTQKQLREAYKGNKFSTKTRGRNQAKNYLNMMSQATSMGGTFNQGSDSSDFTQQEAYMEYRNSYRKQTEQTFQDEESKKVFMIINSFGGSVGNGITVHDALQFIKAGSMTLALGVAASAASLALAGGTIGERYVTEGCHVMIHQPEGGLTGQASDIWIDSQEIMKIRLDVAEIYSLSTYRPRHKILRDLDRDFYLTATETVYYGLADEIATNEVMHEIIEMTTKVWDYHESAQQRLLESRESAANGLDTQTQS